VTEKKPNYSDKNQESSQKAADAYDELMKKENTHYYSYKDLRPSPKELTDAFNKLIRDGLVPVNKKAEDKDSIIVKSIPSIGIDLKKRLSNSNDPNALSKRNKLPNIFEDARAKENGANTLEQLNLPIYRRIKTTIGEFLQNPEKYFSSLRSNLYYPSVMDKKTGIRLFDLGLDESATLNFVKDLIDKKAIFPDYSFTLSEYQKNEISGNITINPVIFNESNRMAEHSGEIYIEIVDGEHVGLAYGEKSPVLIARTNLENNHPDIMNFDVTLKTMEFSRPLIRKINNRHFWQRTHGRESYANFLLLKEIIETGKIYWSLVDDKNRKKDQKAILRYQKLIEQVTKTLHLIPKDQDNKSNFSLNGKAFHPGYYEFIVGPDGTIFIDHRDADNYSNLHHHYLEEMQEIHPLELAVEETETPLSKD